jgi:protein-S-isoprenylcysteine O-methyltransferase Ste14
MTLEQARQPATAGASWVETDAYDWLTRAAVALVFIALTVLSVNAAYHTALEWTDQPVDHQILKITARITNALFLALVAATTVTRLRPIRKAAGLQPRLSALLGTFLAMTLAALPPAELSPIWLAISSGLVIVGTSLAFAVLRWLGKSFSIMAEARRLITGGPYALARHPLYVCEEIALIGVLIQVISPMAILIAVIHGAFQFRRILNEEKVLRATFPQYQAYAADTPRLIPFRLRRMVAAPAPECRRPDAQD